MKIAYYFLILALSFFTTNVFGIFNSLQAQVLSNSYEIVETTLSTRPDEPILITDTRAGAKYENMESYEISSICVYRPKDENGFLENRPVVFFVHGGGWTDGYAPWFDFVAESFTASKGWVVVSADYRLTSDSVYVADENCSDRETCDPENATKAAWYPDNLDDVARAFEFTLDNVDRFGGDPERIFAFGHSAGAHLISLFATLPEYENLRSKIEGVISMSGGYSMKDMNPQTFGKAMELTFLGGYENEDLLKQASPIEHVEQAEFLPPFFVLWCGADLPSLPEQAILFKNKLRAGGFEVEDEFLADYGHVSEMTSFSDPNELPTALVIDFIERRWGALSVRTREEDGLYVFPNPAADFVTVATSENSSEEIRLAKIEILDVTGRKLIEIDSERLPAEINLRSLKSGLYFLRISAERNRFYQKITISR